MSEMQRVLNDLETRRTLPVSAEVQKLDHAARDAARLLREMAADFEKYAMHRVACDTFGAPLPLPDCTCRFDAARAKWRLE